MELKLRLLAEIQMLLAEHETGGLTDEKCVARIKAVLDTPEATAVMLDLMRDSEDDPPPDPLDK